MDSKNDGTEDSSGEDFENSKGEPEPGSPGILSGGSLFSFSAMRFKDYFASQIKVENFRTSLWKPTRPIVELPSLKNYNASLTEFSKSSLVGNFGLNAWAAGFLDRMRDLLPPNWSDSLDVDAALEIIINEGLPMVWVPRASLVEEMISAESREERVQILLGSEECVYEDCKEVLSSVESPVLERRLPLASAALETWKAGHFESAQALAVVVTESAVATSIDGRYANVKRKVLFDPEMIPFSHLRLRAALAPIDMFYTSWFSDSGQPPPVELSRHVSVHQADVDHYTKENSLISNILMVSVLRALQELEEFGDRFQWES